MKIFLMLALKNYNSKTSPEATICHHRIEISMPRFNLLQSLMRERIQNQPKVSENKIPFEPLLKVF